ncbi:hypothetical protein ABRY23_08455 [Melioribacteraceae bacterium 4301-Me]|uniref:hypothetical protein n=1 Tax=Pyranulibacter aquaticus TaxID=3163344 RepID=UPI00359BF182
MQYLNLLLNEKKAFFKFMKTKYPLFYNSNIFLRDIQYAIKSYLEKKEINLTYPQAEKLAIEFAAALEKDGELVNIAPNAWKINFMIEQNNNTAATMLETDNVKEVSQ